MYLVCVSGSWHLAPKTLGISWVTKVKGASFIICNRPLPTTPEFMLMTWLLEERRMVARGTNHVIRGLDHSPPFPASGGSTTYGQRFKQSWLHNGTSIKIPRWQDCENFWVGGHVEVLDGGAPKSGRKLHAPSLYFALCVSSMRLFLSRFLYNKPVIVSKGFSWVLWAMLANYPTQGGILGTPNI